MPGVGAGIPQIQAIATHQIFGEERARLVATALQRIIERFGLAHDVEQVQPAPIGEQRQTTGAQ